MRNSRKATLIAFTRLTGWVMPSILCILLLGGTTTQGGIAAAPGTKSAALSARAANPVASPLPWPRYGIEIIDDTSPEILSAVREAGGKAVRLYLSWSSIDQTNGDPADYRWARTDAALSAIAAAGLEPLIIVYSCPSWACDHSEGPLPATIAPEFGEFMGAMAGRYGRPPYNAHRWEFWNEPDTTIGDGGNLGWGRHGDLYAAMLAATVPGMREADPRATITSGLAFDWFTTDTPTGPFYYDFLPDVLRHGGGAYLDYLGFHYYAANIHWRTIIEKADELRALAAAHGFYKPLVCTETGLTSSSDPRWGTPMWGPNSREIQARYLVRSFAQAHGAGMPGIFWFTISDWPAGQTFQPFGEAGLITADGSRKPAFTAYQGVVRELGEGRFLRSATVNDFGPQVEGYLFAGALSPVWVLWTDGAPLAVTLPQNDVVRVLDMYGAEQVATPRSDGTVEITLDQDPRYVEVKRFQRFNDVPPDFFAYEHIEWLAAREIVSGYSDGTFRPFNSTTRGQVTRIVTLGEGWPLDVSGGPHFSDVPPDNPFYSYIETALAHGVISGYSDGTFRWYDNVTRGQLAKIVVRARGWPIDTAGAPHFIDAPPDNPFYAEIETAYNRGIISGYTLPEGNAFAWGNNATRAHIAKIVHLALVSP